MLYKLLSKVLANRIKPLLSSLVSDFQSAFVLGRLIINNILVAYVVVHFLNKRKREKQGSMSIKLDMSKAYNRVEWD